MRVRDRWARAAAAGAYFVQGLCFASLLTQVPSLQERFHLSDGQLSLILLAVPMVAGVGSLVAGALAPRLGSAPVLRLSALLVCVSMTLVGLAGSIALLLPAVAGFGLVLGAVDATMNMQGVAVQHRYGRSILASFHGWWSLAGILGSLATALASQVRLGLAASLGTVAAFGAVVSLVVGPVLLRPGEERRAAHEMRDAPAGQRVVPRVPWAPIVLIGLAVMLMYISDSATSNWSAVYLHQALHGSKSVAALGLGAYLACQLVGRAVADRVIRLFGPVWTVAVGALVGAAGMALVVGAGRPWTGILGFAVVGFGLCVVVPLSFSAAGALDPQGSGVAIARVNLFNYVGFVVGAALIGAVAEAASLRWAFAVPAVLALCIVGLARTFRLAQHVGGGSVLLEPAVEVRPA